MKTGEEMFLIAAEELNFSRAAKRAFVTPQCLSDHIHRLELQYNAKLFIRRPKTQLTEEGKSLQSYLMRIAALEENMELEIKDIAAGQRGTARISISPTRGRQYVPLVIPSFQARFPDVKVKVTLLDTPEQEKVTLENKVDIALVLGSTRSSLFNSIELIKEPTFFVCTFSLLKKYFLNNFESKLQEFKDNGIKLSEVANMPFVLGNDSSTTNMLAWKIWQKEEIQPKLQVEVSNFYIQIDLCRSGNYATLGSLGQLNYLMTMPKPERDDFCIFQVAGGETLSLELLRPKRRRRKKYLDVLYDTFRNTIIHEEQTLISWLNDMGIRTNITFKIPLKQQD